jgi:hypothetical protein
MDLKEILGVELADKLSASNDETVKQAITKLTGAKLIINDGTMFPKHVYDELDGKYKQSKELIKKHEADLEDLKAKAAGSTTLQQQITELQTANKAEKTRYESELNKERKSLAIKASLMNAGVNSETARNLLAKQFDIEKLELDDKGEVKGIVDLLKPIKDDPAFKSMFGTIKAQGQEHQDGTPPEGLFTREQVKEHGSDKQWMSQNFEKVQKSMSAWSQ